MSRILEAINVVHEANAAPTEATINNLGAEIVSAASNEFDTFAEKFAEWATIASVMPDQRHGTVMIAKTKYRLQQMLQALHQSIYGNRSIEELARGERMERNSVMYCDLENQRYRNSVLPSTLDLPEDGAQTQEDFSDAQKRVNALEGDLRIDAWEHLYRSLKALYELTCEESFVYAPWNEPDRRQSNPAMTAYNMLKSSKKAAAE